MLIKKAPQNTLYFRTHWCPKIVLILCISICCSCSYDTEKRPSPLRYDSAKVAGIRTYVAYSSPAVNGRKIFGNQGALVPNEKLWRTGANKATIISFEEDVKVGSVHLDSGTYSLFTIPRKNEWTLIFNANWDQWGSYDYNDSLDVARLSVPTHTVRQKQERMLFYFADDSLKFRWDKTRWAVPIENPL